MKRYIPIFLISFQQEFAYRLNFIMWRVRGVMQIFLVFFLWDSIFSDPGRSLFGYDRSKILTYVMGTLFLRAFVFSARSVDVPGEIAEGNLTNYLLKPVSYIKYWLTRDLSSKALNAIFALAEFSILYLILKPSIFVQRDPVLLVGFVLSLVVAMLLFFLFRFIVSLVPFWAPELAWGAQFLLVFIVVEFFSGALFPLDILPRNFQSILYLTPFPYFLFFPLQVYLGKIEPDLLIKGLIVSLFWSVALWSIFNFVWKKGLKVYQGEGR